MMEILCLYTCPMLLSGDLMIQYVNASMFPSFISLAQAFQSLSVNSQTACGSSNNVKLLQKEINLPLLQRYCLLFAKKLISKCRMFTSIRRPL